MIDTERILETSLVLQDLGWYDASVDIIEKGYDLGLRAESCGFELASAVIRGYWTMREVRDGIAWASAADNQVERLEVADRRLLASEDLWEATARRLAHKSGRRVLQLIGRKDQQWAFGVRHGLLKQQR